MNRLVAFGLSMLVNAALLGAMGLNAYLADKTPAGQVYITQLTTADTTPALAKASS